MSSRDLPRMINGVASKRLVTAIRSPIPKIKPIRLGIRKHLLVVALQADDRTRRFSLKIEQLLHHGPAVWSTVDVVPKEDEACFRLARIAPAGGEKAI